MSRLDALEKAVISLTKQAGLAYDLQGTGLENDPLGDADGDGRPNIMDSHPRSAIQAGPSLKKAPATSYDQVTFSPMSSVGSSNGISNERLIDTITTLVLVQLLSKLQGMASQTSGASGANASVNAANSVSSSPPTQDYFDLLNDYGNLYNVYNKIYFIDDNNSVVDGGSLVGELVSKENIPTSSQVSSWSYTKPQDYIELRDHYRTLWDSYYMNVGTPPHFAQKR